MDQSKCANIPSPNYRCDHEAERYPDRNVKKPHVSTSVSCRFTTSSEIISLSTMLVLAKGTFTTSPFLTPLESLISMALNLYGVILFLILNHLFRVISANYHRLHQIKKNLSRCVLNLIMNGLGWVNHAIKNYKFLEGFDDSKCLLVYHL